MNPGSQSIPEKKGPLKVVFELHIFWDFLITAEMAFNGRFTTTDANVRRHKDTPAIIPNKSTSQRIR